jgi:hypothetical protein
MSIVLDHSEIKDKIIDGNLILYFPHSIELSENAKSLAAIEWLNYWGFKVDKRKGKSIVIYPHSFVLKDCFYNRTHFDYVQSDNKNIDKTANEIDLLNLIFSKSFMSMDIARKSTSIIEGISEKDNSIKSKMMGYNFFHKNFSHRIDKFFYEKDFQLDENLKENLKNSKKEIFYNDFHVIKDLDSRILFLRNNFDEKNSYYIKKEHIYNKSIEYVNIGGINFVEIESKKEIVSYSEINNHMKGMFSSSDLFYNIISGIIFSTPRESIRKIDLSNKEFLKETPGYVFSKTSNKLKVEGISFENKDDFNSNILQYNLIKSRWYFDPHYLLSSLVMHCDNINKIINNKEFDLSKDENVRVFIGGMLDDLVLGMKKLGMFQVEDFN